LIEADEWRIPLLDSNRKVRRAVAGSPPKPFLSRRKAGRWRGEGGLREERPDSAERRSR